MFALRPEAVVHCQRAEFPTPFVHPAIRQNGEGEAVGTPGHGDGNERTGFEARERGNCGPEFG